MQVSEAAHEVVHPDNLVWIIVGDHSIIESKIRALNLGEIFLMDSDGNVIEGSTQ